MQEKLFIIPTKIIPILTQSTELSDVFFRQCAFCQKIACTSSEFQQKTLFYCPFCIRHKQHTRNNRHVLILSFRNILGYFYHQKYLSNRPTMYLSEIYDYCAIHMQSGLQNPCFSYDSETLLWFIDFSLVGRNKIPFTSVKKTVVDILACFKLEINLPQHQQIYPLYEIGLENFYQYRRSPKNKMLIPQTAEIEEKMCFLQKFEKKC